MKSMFAVYKDVFTSRILRTYYMLLLLGGVAVSIMTCYSSVWLVQNFGIGTDRVAHLIMISGLLGIVCNPLIGFVSDRWNCKKQLILGIFGLFAVMFFAFATTKRFFLAAIMVAVSGIGLMGPVLSGATKYVKASPDFPPEQETAVVSVVRQAWSVGHIFGPLIGDAVVAEITNIAHVFFVSCGLILISCFLYLLAVHQQRGEELQESVTTKKIRTPISVRQGVFGVLKELPLLIPLLLAFVMLWSPAQTRTTFLSLLMTMKLGFPASMYGRMITAFSITQVIVFPIAGKLIGRFGAYRMLLVSASFGVVYCLLQFTCERYYIILMLQMMLGIAAGLWNVGTMQYLQNVYEGRHGFASGCYVAVGQAPSLIVGMVMGPVSAKYEINVVFFAAAIMCATGMLLISLIHIILYQRRKRANCV